MSPSIALDGAIVAANARAWQAFAGVPLCAVVKGDGYGWGYPALVNALEGHVTAFCVSDEDEWRALRRYSTTHAIILGNVPLEHLGDVLTAGALPNIGTTAELAVAEKVARAAGRALSVRVGVRAAAPWSGLSLDELRDFAPLLARAGALVELWSHVTDWENRTSQLTLFRAAGHVLRAAGVRVTRTEVASTFPLAADGAQGSSVRVGIGLFGATGGNAVPGVRCALRVVAPVTRIERISSETRIGYGGVVLGAGMTIATARCGYADGLPKSLMHSGDLLSIGMQYITVRASRLNATGSHVVLLDETTNLDLFAEGAGLSPHEIVTAFGNAACASASLRRHG